MLEQVVQAALRKTVPTKKPSRAASGECTLIFKSVSRPMCEECEREHKYLGGLHGAPSIGRDWGHFWDDEDPDHLGISRDL